MAAIHVPTLLTSRGRLATKSPDYNSFDDIWISYHFFPLSKGFITVSDGQSLFETRSQGGCWGPVAQIDAFRKVRGFISMHLKPSKISILKLEKNDRTQKIEKSIHQKLSSHVT